MHSLLSVRIQTKNQYLFLLSLLFCVSFFFFIFFSEQNLPLKNYHDVLMESFPCQRRDGNRSVSQDRHWEGGCCPLPGSALNTQLPQAPRCPQHPKLPGTNRGWKSREGVTLKAQRALSCWASWRTDSRSWKRHFISPGSSFSSSTGVCKTPASSVKKLIQPQPALKSRENEKSFGGAV